MASWPGSPSVSLVAACLLVLAAACGAEGSATSTPAPTTPAPTPEPTAIVEPASTPDAPLDPGEFDVTRATEHVRVLSVDIGRREAGTPGDARAADYIAGRIEALGWSVERRPFPLPQGGESWNVVGLPPGFDERSPYLLVGGHYDSLRGPGANDNATGIGVALEIARAVDGRPAALPVAFVAFGGEERQPAPGRPHHVGSQHFVPAMSPEARSNLVLYMNIDEVGGAGRIVCGRMSVGPREGTERCLRTAIRLGIEAWLSVTPDWSDNGSFLREGLNAAWLWTDDACCTHTPRDTFEKVDRTYVERVGAVALAILRSYEARVSAP